MRILKYFLLLIALSTLSLAVFILTQSGAFSVKKSFTLDAPQTVIYDYLHNIENWNDWITTTKLEASTYEITVDQIGVYSIRQEYSHPYDSLSQDILKDQKISNIVWKLKPNGKKTNVELTFQSSLDLQTKILTFFNGTPDEVASNALDKNINALIVYFIKQYKNYEIETTGVTNQPQRKYLYISSTTKLADIELAIPKLDKQVRDFCTTNQVTILDSPFLIVNNQLGDSIISLDYAIPIKENIYLNEDEMYKVGILPKETYFETKFSGHYVHLKQALVEINHAISRGEAVVNPNQKIILSLIKSSAETKKPAEWSTIFYIPVTVAPVDPNPAITYQNGYRAPISRDSIKAQYTKPTTESPSPITEEG